MEKWHNTIVNEKVVICGQLIFSVIIQWNFIWEKYNSEWNHKEHEIIIMEVQFKTHG